MDSANPEWYRLHLPWHRWGVFVCHGSLDESAHIENDSFVRSFGPVHFQNMSSCQPTFLFDIFYASLTCPTNTLSPSPFQKNEMKEKTVMRCRWLLVVGSFPRNHRELLFLPEDELGWMPSWEKSAAGIERFGCLQEGISAQTMIVPRHSPPFPK